MFYVEILKDFKIDFVGFLAVGDPKNTKFASN